MNIVAEHMPDGKIRLVEDFGEVPTGFICDGASIPRFFWRLVGHPYDKIHIKNGVKHDYAYTLGGDELMRYAADCDYRDGIRRDGAGIIRSQLEYLTLRIFGASHFNFVGKTKKRKDGVMKKIISIATISIAAIAAGCARTIDIVVNGEGWEAHYANYGLKTDVSSIEAEKGADGTVKVKVKGLVTDVSAEHKEIVAAGGTAVGNVAEKVIEAAKH